MRNSNVVKSTYNNSSGFIDAVDWEKLKRSGDVAVKRWINDQLHGTSVTVVLIGAETYKRDWVLYEIEKSIEKGNGLLGIYIHNIENQYKSTDWQGQIPLPDGYYYHSQIYNGIYDWVNGYGYYNIGEWIEQAARAVGR